MPNYKKQVTLTPNASVIACPFTDDVIYATADNVGNVTLQWTAASAELTRVVATYNGEDQILMVIPEFDGYVTTEYKVFYDTNNTSAAIGDNDGSLGDAFNVAGGASFGVDGLTVSVNGDGARFSGSASGYAFVSNLTMMAKVTTRSGTINGYIIACDAQGESSDTNWLYGVKISLTTVSYFHEYGNGSNVSASFPYSFLENTQYILEIVRADNGNGTCNIEFFVDGVSIGIANGLTNSQVGASPQQVLTLGSVSDYTDSFNGVIHKALIDNRVIPSDERAGIRAEWSA